MKCPVRPTDGRVERIVDQLKNKGFDPVVKRFLVCQVTSQTFQSPTSLEFKEREVVGVKLQVFV